MRRLLCLCLVALTVIPGLSGCSKDHKGADKRTTTTASSSEGTEALTGLPLPGGVNASRGLLIVKVDNDPAAVPQTGLAQADVVFEEMVEGGATRFAALYHSTDAEVGPVRSARSTDLSLATSFGRPMFAYSGANDVFRVLLRKSVFVDVGVDAVPAAYAVHADRKAPSNLYATTTKLYSGAQFNGTPPKAMWPFGAAGRGDAAPAGEVSVTFPGPAATKVRWTWDAAGKVWNREQNGRAHVDAASGAVLSAANVIVQFAPYGDTMIRDQSGAPVPEAKLIGKGEAWFFTDGKVIKGTWSKPSITKPTVFADGTGTPVALTPGRTWVELAPPGSGSLR